MSDLKDKDTGQPPSTWHEGTSALQDGRRSLVAANLNCVSNCLSDVNFNFTMLADLLNETVAGYHRSKEEVLEDMVVSANQARESALLIASLLPNSEQIVKDAAAKVFEAVQYVYYARRLFGHEVNLDLPKLVARPGTLQDSADEIIEYLKKYEA
jgi:hypothetical protein